MTNINDEMQIIDLALWMPKSKTLAISDLHIGYEEALNRQGIMIPRHQLVDTMDRLRKIFSALKIKPKRIIINGDLKHEFGTVNREEFFGVKEVINLLLKNCKELIILEGNHDKILGYAKKERVKIKPYLKSGSILFLHGDKIMDIDSDTIVIGHSHPAIKLSDGIANEKVKCFLKGSYKGKTLIALPAFNQVTEGTDIIEGETLSPYLNEAKNLEVWAVPSFNDILHFGSIKNISALEHY